MDKKTMQLLDRVKNEIANRMFAQERGADSKGNILYWKRRFAEDAAENIIQNYSTLNFLTTKAILLL